MSPTQEQLSMYEGQVFRRSYKIGGPADGSFTYLPDDADTSDYLWSPRSSEPFGWSKYRKTSVHFEAPPYLGGRQPTVVYVSCDDPHWGDREHSEDTVRAALEQARSAGGGWPWVEDYALCDVWMERRKSARVAEENVS